MATLSKNALSSIRPSLRRTGRENLLPKLRVPLSAYVVDCAVYVDGRRLDGRFTPRPGHRGGPRAGRGLRLDRAARARPTTRSRPSPRPTACTSWRWRTPSPRKQRPKLERYEDSLFMVLKTVTYVEHDEPTTATELIKTGEVMAFVGPDFIVTVRHGDHCGLHRVREKLEADPEQLALGPAAVLHAIADHIVDQYVAVTDAIEKDMDEIEAEVFEPRLGHGLRADLRHEARGAGAAPLGGAAGGAAAQAHRGLLRAGAARGALLLPRRRRPPLDRHRAGDGLRRAAHHARRRRAREDHAAAEQRHAQDHRVRGPRSRCPRWWRASTA